MTGEVAPLFKRFVGDSDDALRGMVAYGIYKTAKREWIQAFQATHGRIPTSAEAQAYSSTWTNQLISNAEDAAESALSEFASEAITEASPTIIQEALRGRWWASILLSMGANLAYTILLLAIVIVLKLMGVDVIAALQAIPTHR